MARTKTIVVHMGGNFAPRITDEVLVVYRRLAATATPEIREVITNLCKMVEVFHETPESDLPGTPHPSLVGEIVPLAPEEIQRIWDLVPWPHECEGLERLFDTLPETEADRANAKRNQEYKARGEIMPRIEWTPTLRNALQHLIWYAKTLSVDREPYTAEKARTQI